MDSGAVPDAVTQDLLPCPKCGGDAQARSSSDGEAEWFQCRKCGHQSMCKLSYREAITAWNTRLTASPTSTDRMVLVADGDDYPASQDEAARGDYWRFHSGSVCPASCDLVYYRRKADPDQVFGPTPPALIRWTSTNDGSDILAWHPVYSGFQRRHRLAAAPAVAPSTNGWRDDASANAEARFSSYHPAVAVTIDRIIGMYRFDTPADRARAHEACRAVSGHLTAPPPSTEPATEVKA